GYYTRLRAYLLKISGKGIRFCAKVTSTKLEELKKLDSESTLLHESKKAKSIPLPPLSNASELDSRKRRANGPLEKAFNVNARETLDSHIARMFFSSGLPFHLAKNPYFVKAFSYAANNYIDGYIPPGYNKLRTDLLEKEKQHVENSGKGVSIVSDGWCDPQRRLLRNFMAVTKSGTIFLKAVDCSDEIKDKDYVAKQIRDVIREVGLSN
ncbi:hypothetical protein HN51_065493, partial [Arachis hypogaea]